MTSITENRRAALRTIAVVAAVLAAWVPALADAQPGFVAPGQGVEVRTATQKNYVAVVGAVKRSGVYEFETRNPRLVDVIASAHGPADSTATLVRIVRNGRENQTVFLSPQSQIQLFAGDTLIVERQPVVGLASTSHQEHGGLVDIAFVNLIDRPVVVHLRRESASLLGLVSLFRQQTGTVPGGTIHFAGQQRISKPFPAEENFALSSGTTVVFDRPLPVTAFAHPFDPPVPGLTLQLNQSAPFRRQTSHGIEVAAGQYPTEATATQPQLLATNPLTGQQQTAQRNWTPPIAAAPPVPEPVELNESSTELVASEEFNLTDAEIDGANLAAVEETQTAASADEGGSRLSVALLLAVAALSGTGLALISIRRMERKTKTSNVLPLATAEQQPASATTLDALIQDRLPVTEEPCETPTSIAFFEKLHDSKKHRADASQGIAAPHFHTASRAQRAAAMRESADIVQPSDEPVFRVDAQHAPSKKPHKTSQPVSQGPGILDRAFSHVQGTPKR